MKDQIAPLEGLTLGAALRRSAELYTNLEFIKSGDAAWTFSAFDRATDRLASGLLALGVSSGDHVAVWLNNSVDWALTLCACARIGAVLVPINTRYTASEAHYLLANSDAKLLVLSRRLWGKDYLEMLDSVALGAMAGAAGELSLSELPGLRRLVFSGDDAPEGSQRFQDLLDGPVADDLAQLAATVRPEQPMLICYTSGTTGKPKGAMHNHLVLKQATRVGLSCRLDAGGRVLGHMPLYHVAGLYMGLVPALTLGACFVVMPQWNSGLALELMERERITMFGGIPTHFVDLAEHPDVGRRDLSSLRVAWIGGSPVMQATYDNFVRTLGLQNLLSTYGMTENTISTTFNRLSDPPAVCCENRAPVLANCEVRVVDPQTGEARPTGEIGEVWCRGETVMMGYYKNPQATRETITEGGWLRTGDLGRFDDEGYLSITGRLKEMYKSGGTNVYPAEVEQHLTRLPGVRLAAVVGVPDERMGEVGFAFIEPVAEGTVNEADLREQCRGVLAAYKIPRHFAIVPEIPRTSTGKIAKAELAATAQQMLAG
jgi:fatty-acyl-CoA synthase